MTVDAVSAFSKRRLSRVRVSDDRDYRQVAAHAPRALHPAAGANLLDLFFEKMDSVTHAAPIDFEFCFAGTASADSAHQPRHLNARAGQARQHVFQLRKLDLNLSFAALRALGKDIEDELSAIDDLEVGRFVDRAHLRGREILIEDDRVRAELQAANDQLIELAFADQRSRIELLPCAERSSRARRLPPNARVREARPSTPARAKRSRW